MDVSKAAVRNRLFLVLDLGLTLAMLVIMSVALTGIAWHEWLGLAFLAVIVLHIVLHWQWIARTTWRWFSAQTATARLTYGVDTLLFILMVLAIFSGVLISQSALPALGLFVGGRNFAWRAIHSFTADASLALVGVHLAINWRWLLAVVQRMFVKPASQTSAVRVTLEPAASTLLKEN